MGNCQKKAAIRKRRSRSSTKGQLNYLIDDLLHPLYKVNEGFVLVDGVLHAIIERDPPLSVKKFLKYNLPTVMKQVRKLMK
jgi:hypothetical protein